MIRPMSHIIPCGDEDNIDKIGENDDDDFENAD